MLYGTHGIGKTTWASKWPKPILLPTEDGFADIEIDTLPLITDALTVPQAAFELSSEQRDHSFKTVVLDSADWLEQLIWADIVKEANSSKIETVADIEFGKGYATAADRLRQVLRAFDQCRDIGMHVLVLAHCEVKKFASPESDTYDRYMPKLHKQSAAIIQEWADEVLFASYKTFTRTTDEGFGRERAVGVGTGQRVLRTQEMPGFLAKNRLGLPSELPFDFSEYAKYLPPLGNVAGAINNGSSKPATVQS